MSRTPKDLDTSTFTGQVAAQIRARRVRGKKTPDEAAAAAGVPVQTWYNWERGRHLPLAALPAIAAALGCRPRMLLPS